jgi:putative transposase
VPSTHLSLHYHLVFSTKERRPLIETAWRGRLHAYLGGAVRACGGVAEAVGGTDDHVHLLVGLRATHRLADVLREIKQSSSRWAHETVGANKFAWQEGYGAFTVSVSNLARVRAYVAGQEEHHRRKTFQEEYLALLRQSGVEYDERFLW